MQPQARPVCPGLHNLLFCHQAAAAARKTTLIHHLSPSGIPTARRTTSPHPPNYSAAAAAAAIRRRTTFQRCSPNMDFTPSPLPDYSSRENEESSSDDDYDEQGFEFDIQVTGDNSRRIRSRTAIDASLQTVWDILTDYEKLPDIIPSLLLSQLIEKKGNMARLFQIGEQKIALGLNFSAKGFIDCYEKDLESLPHCLRRDIEFKMMKGDFRVFEGKWSIEQYNLERCEGRGSDQLLRQEFPTTLSYLVDVEPKRWLPVRLVQGRICREIKMNLSCIKLEAEKRSCC